MKGAKWLALVHTISAVGTSTLKSFYPNSESCFPNHVVTDANELYTFPNFHVSAVSAAFQHLR